MDLWQTVFKGASTCILCFSHWQWSKGYVARFVQVVTIRRLAVTETETRALGNYKRTIRQAPWSVCNIILSCLRVVNYGYRK